MSEELLAELELMYYTVYCHIFGILGGEDSNIHNGHTFIDELIGFVLHNLI